MSSNQLPNTSPDIDLLSKTLLSTLAKCSNQNDETEFVLPTEYNMMELLNHIAEYIKPTTDTEIKEVPENSSSMTDHVDLSRSERAVLLSTSLAKIMPAPQVRSRKRSRTIIMEDEPLDLSPPAKRAPVQQRSSVIFRTPEVASVNSSELETDNMRNDTPRDQGFPFSLKSVGQKMPKVYIDPMGMPRIEMIEQKSLVSGMQRASKPVLSVPKLNVTSANSSEVKSSHTVDSSSSFSVYPTSVPQKSPVVFLDQIGMPQIQMTEQKYMSSGMQQHLKRVSAASLVSPKDIPPNNHDSLSKSLATTSQKSSAVLSDQMKILRHKLMELQKTDSGMQEKPMPVSKANVLVPATNATSPQETELMPTTIPLAPTIILDTQGVANLKVKKPESIDDSMTQNKKCTPIANPATTPSTSTSNAIPDPSRLTSNAESALSSLNSSANATSSSPTSQNQSEVPISGTQLVPFDASRALLSKPNTVPKVTHQRIAPVPQQVPPFLNPFGQPTPMQGGQKMQVHSNFAMHPAHLPYPAIPGFMGHPGFVPPMMFPPYPQMFHPYHSMPAFSFFHPQMIPPPHMIVPSPVSDIFQPADEVLQYLLNDLKDKELLNRLRHVPEPLPEAFWIGLREDTTAKTKVIENMGSKLCGDFRNCAFMSQAKSEVIGKKHGVSGQVICSAYARYRFCNRRSGYFRVREKLDHFHCVRLRKSLKLLWSGESAENVLAELRRADDPFPLLEILEAERRKGIIYTMNFYKERLLKRKKRNMNPLLSWALKEPSAEEVDNDKNIPFELIRVVRLLLHFKSYEAVTEHLIENPSSLLLPNVISDSIVKKEPLDEEPDEQYTQFIRNYYRLSSENWDNSQSQQGSAPLSFFFR
ncbi:unnamed protein product [Caenorhabditis nigoni]